VQRVKRVQRINNLKKRRSWFEVQRRRDVRASRKIKPIVRQCFLVSKDGSLKKEEMKKKGRSLEREVEETRAGLKSEEEEKRRERENFKKN
jgi:hypothetical protein